MAVHVKRQVKEGISGPEVISRNLDLSTLSSCKLVTPAPLPAIAKTNQGRVQDSVPYKQKRRAPLRAFSKVDTMLMSNGISEMARKREGFVFKTERVI